MRRALRILLVLVLSVLLAAPAEANVKIRTLVRLLGEETIHVTGVGLVTGLNGSGDKSPAAIKALRAWLEQNNIAVSATDVTSKNIALVQVDAMIPAFTRPGEMLSVRVTSMFDASSLAGGVLANTQLKARPDGDIYAIAFGRILVGGATTDTIHPTSGRIPSGSEGGAQVLKVLSADVVEPDNRVRLILRRRSFADAATVARRINTDESTNPYLKRAFGFDESEIVKVAWALDAGQVIVRIPDAMRDKKVEYISEVLDLDVAVRRPARVLINRQNNIVVITGEVRVDPVVISHRNLTVTVAAPGQNDGGVDTGRREYRLNDADERAVIEMEGHNRTPNLRQFIDTLNAMGVTTADVAVILQKLEAAGALHAELKVE